MKPNDIAFLIAVFIVPQIYLSLMLLIPFSEPIPEFVSLELIIKIIIKIVEKHHQSHVLHGINCNNFVLVYFQYHQLNDARTVRLL